MNTGGNNMIRGKRYVLFIEDDEVDQEAVRRAFKELDISSPLQIISNSEEALKKLNSLPKNNLPALILLDLRMSRMDGMELLRYAKTHELLKRIPIIILTTSNMDSDKLEAFNLGAAGYMIKPVGHEKLTEIIRTIDHYWTLSEMPPLPPSK